MASSHWKNQPIQIQIRSGIRGTLRAHIAQRSGGKNAGFSGLSPSLKVHYALLLRSGLISGKVCSLKSFPAFCDLVIRVRPNTDQSVTVNFVQKGHNVLINGQAGVGKSEVLKFIIRSLRAVGKKLGT